MPPTPAGRRARSGALRVAVLADTHLHSRSIRANRAIQRLPETAWRYLRDAGVILHAGDVLDEGILGELRRLAPVYAVLGNNDHSLVGILPVTRLVELDGVRIGMIHDSGAAAGRACRLRRRFPDANVVVFGHSHAPVNEVGEDGQLLFNPGSPTQRRAQPFHSIGELQIMSGQVTEHHIIRLDPPGAGSR
jgi:putative phosphoesterase